MVVAPTDALQALVSTCQMLAGSVHWSGPHDVLTSLAALGDDVPDQMPRINVLTARAVLIETLSRTIRHLRLDRDPDVAQEFVCLCGRPVAWRDQWVRTVVAVRKAISTDRRDARLDPRRANDILAVVCARACESHVTLRDIAHDVQLSPSYVAKTLRRATGAGFLAHLNRERVEKARVLLTTASLSVKEIAAAVGYAQQSQLTRHFRLAYGLTPSQFRARGRSPQAITYTSSADSGKQ